MAVTILSATHQLHARARFCLLFAAWALCFSLIFENWQSLFATGYLQPVSAVTAVLLNSLGVVTEMDASPLSQGFCLLRMERVTFRVIFECTGMFCGQDGPRNYVVNVGPVAHLSHDHAKNVWLRKSLNRKN